MKKTVLAFTAILATTTPAVAQVVGPVPVIDVGSERLTWIQQLLQAEQQVQQAKQAVQIATQNITPTGFGWPTSQRGVGAIEPLLDAALGRLSGYQQTVARQGGAPVAPDTALQAAQSGMQQLAGEQADLQNAQDASDSAPGDLAAAQAGHRISALQVSDGAKLRQFLYAQQIQRSVEQAEIQAWFTMPLDPTGEAGMETQT